ncbi:MAG TPA: ATP-binding SpoIIE family protein phosphatase [Steroidobacteraceae bacterium]|jgi:anti-sigma regulatory factor (Ser/Thr protein kinase)|nr:ATP-binding SpoIIE family protein phosphatase [Steroidobacteraceae bacterium]
MSTRLIHAGSQWRSEVRDQSDIGECRRMAKRLAQTRGFDEQDVGRVCIVATELATNLVRHGGGGEMLLQVLEDGVVPQLEMMVMDRGPGMRDVGECLRDGYSSAGTPGTGLGAVSRLSAVFDVFSTPDKGTIVLSRVARASDAGSRASLGAPEAAATRLEFGAICIALAGEIECGDCWCIADDGSTVSLLVADGLGHGPLAATAARAAAEAFEERPFDDPLSVVQNLNRRLSGGRGAVAACAQLHPAPGKLEYAGVGNISGVISQPSASRGLVSFNGTLGTPSVRCRQFDYECPPDGVVIMHSDGLSARWHLGDYPGLHRRHPAVIAGVLFRDHARKHDDATVLVARQRP